MNYQIFILFCSLLISFSLVRLEGTPPKDTPYTTTISYVDYDQHLIYLSNNTLWKVSYLRFPKERVDRWLLTWKEGDVVFAVYSGIRHMNASSWILTNEDAGGNSSYSGNLIVDLISYENLPKIKSSDEGRTLILSDDSVWDIGWWSGRKTQNWKVKDNIMVFPDYETFKPFDSNTHFLINVLSKESAKATLINKAY